MPSDLFQATNHGRRTLCSKIELLFRLWPSENCWAWKASRRPTAAARDVCHSTPDQLEQGHSPSLKQVVTWRPVCWYFGGPGGWARRRSPARIRPCRGTTDGLANRFVGLPGASLNFRYLMLPHGLTDGILQPSGRCKGVRRQLSIPGKQQGLECIASTRVQTWANGALFETPLNTAALGGLLRQSSIAQEKGR